MRRPARRGFTLVECAVVCAIAGMAAAIVLPGLARQRLRAGRFDAVQALTRIQIAQEQLRGATGLYAPDLPTLGRLGPNSLQGLYQLSVASTGPDGYVATAQAIGPQADDSACASITLTVSDGFAQSGPTSDCWNR